MSDNEAFLTALYRGESDRRVAFTSAPVLRGVIDHPDGDYSVSEAPIDRWVPWAVENYLARTRIAEAMQDDTVPVARLSTGTQIFAAAFGCPVESPGDTNPFALPLVRDARQADAIELPDIWNVRGLCRVFELARLVEKELGPETWLGACDMQTGFDITSLVWNKEDLFIAMADPSEAPAVHRLADKCASLFERFIMELRREFPRMSLCGCPTVWSPPELGPWPSNDECGSVSTAMFEEYMLPELVRLSERFGSIGMHCCAAADHQMASFRMIPGFYAFNRVPPPGAGDAGFDAALAELGGPDGPVFVLGWMSPQSVAHGIEVAPEGTRFIFQHVVTDLDDGKRDLEQMRSLV